MTDHTPVEWTSYFARYVLEVAGEPVTVSEIEQQARESNLNNQIEIATQVNQPHAQANIYETTHTDGKVMLEDAVPTGDCPPDVASLYETHLPEDVTPTSTANTSFTLETGTNMANTSLSVDDPATKLDPFATSEEEHSILADAGIETIQDVAETELNALVNVPGVNQAEARDAIDQAQIIIQNNRSNVTEALARAVGYDTQRHQIPSVDDLKSRTDGRATPSATVADIQDIKQPPGDPVGLAPDSNTFDEIAYHSLPILRDIDHPLVPDMDNAVEPKTVELETGETTLEAISNTLALSDKGLLLEGPHGCGKNYMIKWVMAQTNRPIISIDLNESMLAEQLIGSIMPQEDGSVQFEDKLIPKAVKYGIPIIFNELRAAPPDITMALHQLLESNQLVIDESGEYIEPHPAFRFIATTNPNTVEYTGAGALNQAFLDRLRTIQVSYLPKNKETSLLDEKFNRHQSQIPRDVIKIFVDVGAESRIEDTTPTLSTRKLEDAIEWAIQSGNPRGALKEIITGCASPRDDKDHLFEFMSDTVPKTLN